MTEHRVGILRRHARYRRELRREWIRDAWPVLAIVAWATLPFVVLVVRWAAGW